jgi:NADH-quinone oxidoreductase subunit M
MIGLPILGGFIGEFMILLGTFTGVSKGWAIAATMGVILGAAYMLWLIQRLFFGPESALALSKPPEDLRAGQLAVVWPLAALMLVMGVAPGLWLYPIEQGVRPPQAAQLTREPAVAPPQPALPAATDGEGQR